MERTKQLMLAIIVGVSAFFLLCGSLVVVGAYLLLVMRPHDEDPRMVAAIESNDVPTVELLLKNGSNPRSHYYFIPARGVSKPIIHLACEVGSAKIVQLLTEAGAEPNEIDCMGRTPLLTMAAASARAGYAACAEYLIGRGADISARTREGDTALHLCAFFDDVDYARVLIRAGADVSARTREKKTALHICAAQGYVAYAQVLIEAGADVNATDDHGFTPLHSACERFAVFNESMITLLIKHGACANRKDHSGKIPRDYLRERGLECVLLGAEQEASQGRSM